MRLNNPFINKPFNFKFTKKYALWFKKAMKCKFNILEGTIRSRKRL